MARATARTRSWCSPRMMRPPTLPQPNPSIDTRRPVFPSARYSMANPLFIPSSLVSNAINHVGTIIRDEQRAVGHYQDVNGAPPGLMALQPPLGEHVVGHRPTVVKAHQADAITDPGGAIPRPMFGDENLVAILLRKHRPGIKAHPKRRHVGTQLHRRRRELVTAPLSPELRIGDILRVAIGVSEVHAWPRGM